MKRVVILGSTGSVGTQALEVIRLHRDNFRIVGLAAGQNRRLLEKQSLEFGGEVALGEIEAEQMAGQLEADLVVNAITGSVGLPSTLAALRSGKQLALANKESLVAGGELVKRASAPQQLISIDSEHVAIAQGLRAGTREDVTRIIITASGGPFRGRRREQLASVTPREALRHPTWDMGVVITTNSATMVNKGLEVIEAHLLFDVPYERIEVVVHPQSMIHSMVEFKDGSTIAHASIPTMQLAISFGLAWPDRVELEKPRIDWSRAGPWTFEDLDDETFPAVNLAKQVGAAGKTFPAVFNAANERAVRLFHEGRLPFLEIVETARRVVEMHDPERGDMTVESIVMAERWAKDQVLALIGAL